MHADTLMEGRIWCGLHEGFAEALAISGNRIVAVGRRGAVRALAGPRTRRIALSIPVLGGVLLVGFLLMQVVPTDPAAVRAGPIRRGPPLRLARSPGAPMKRKPLRPAAKCRSWAKRAI